MNESTAPEGASAEESTVRPEMNGTAAPGPSSSEVGATAVTRAEELLDTVGQRLGSWATSLEHTFRLLGARAREEAEDMLAEAQALRAGNGHQQTAHPNLPRTPHIERIDEEPSDQAPADQAPADQTSGATRPQDETARTTDGVYQTSAETATATPDAADVP